MQNDILQNWSTKPPLWPLATAVLVLVCALLMLVYSLLSPLQQAAFINVSGVIPAVMDELLKQPIKQWWSDDALPLVSSLFVHSSWVHLLSNMAFLWVFGMPVERRLGHVLFLLLFLLGGAVSNAVVSLQLAEYPTTVVGASGAVSTVIGAYLGLFPSQRMGLYLPLGLFMQFARVPAVLVIGAWFTLQLLYSVFGPIAGAVAWWTHVAGFCFGLLVAILVRIFDRLRYHYG